MVLTLFDVILYSWILPFGYLSSQIPTFEL
jgi:hypothetical protein